MYAITPGHSIAIRRQFLLVIVAVVLGLTVCTTASSQDSLRVLSWNIQMLPRPVKPGGKAKRAKAIVRQLTQRQYDVVIFQELFHKRARRIVTKGLRSVYPEHTQILNKKTIALKTNGGVMIFSRHPIIEIHQIRYTERSGFDKMSRKGALLAELDIDGKRIQVAGTHLQAFGAQEIMYSQYQQLAKELLEPHAREGVPQLLCGDFNTLKTLPPKLPDNITQDFVNRLPRYSFMLHTLNAEDGDLAGDQQFTMDRPFNDLCERRKEYRLLLDYALIRRNGTEVSVNRAVKIIRERWDPEHEDLSDHFSLEAIITGLK